MATVALGRRAPASLQCKYELSFRTNSIKISKSLGRPGSKAQIGQVHVLLNILTTVSYLFLTCGPRFLVVVQLVLVIDWSPTVLQTSTEIIYPNNTPTHSLQCNAGFRVLAKPLGYEAPFSSIFAVGSPRNENDSILTN